VRIAGTGKPKRKGMRSGNALLLKDIKETWLERDDSGKWPRAHPKCQVRGSSYKLRCARGMEEG